MSGGSISNYTFLAYIEEDIDKELEGMIISDRSKEIIAQMKLLYWELYLLTKSLDYYLDGDHNERQFWCDWNSFRKNTGFTPRAD